MNDTKQPVSSIEATLSQSVGIQLTTEEILSALNELPNANEILELLKSKQAEKINQQNKISAETPLDTKATASELINGTEQLPALSPSDITKILSLLSTVKEISNDSSQYRFLPQQAKDLLTLYKTYSGDEAEKILLLLINKETQYISKAGERDVAMHLESLVDDIFSSNNNSNLAVKRLYAFINTFTRDSLKQVRNSALEKVITVLFEVFQNPLLTGKNPNEIAEIIMGNQDLKDIIDNSTIGLIQEYDKAAAVPVAQSTLNAITPDISNVAETVGSQTTTPENLETVDGKEKPETELTNTLEFKDEEEFSPEFLTQFIEDYLTIGVESEDIKKLLDTAKLERNKDNYQLLIIDIGGKELTIKFKDKKELSQLTCAIVKKYYEFSNDEGLTKVHLGRISDANFADINNQEDYNRVLKLLALHQNAKGIFDRSPGPIGSVKDMSALTIPLANYWEDILELDFSRDRIDKYLESQSAKFKLYADKLKENPLYSPSKEERDFYFVIMSYATALTSEEREKFYTLPLQSVNSADVREVNVIMSTFINGVFNFIDTLDKSLDKKIDTDKLNVNVSNSGYKSFVAEFIRKMIEYATPTVMYNPEGRIVDTNNIDETEYLDAGLAKSLITIGGQEEMNSVIFEEIIIKQFKINEENFINGNKYQQGELRKKLNLSSNNWINILKNQIGPLKIGNNYFVGFKFTFNDSEKVIYFKLPSEESMHQVVINEIKQEAKQNSFKTAEKNLEDIANGKRATEGIALEIQAIFGMPFKYDINALKEFIEKSTKNSLYILSEDVKLSLGVLYQILQSSEGSLDKLKVAISDLSNPLDFAKNLYELLNRHIRQADLFSNLTDYKALALEENLTLGINKIFADESDPMIRVVAIENFLNQDASAAA